MSQSWTHDYAGIALCEIAAYAPVEIPAVYPAPLGEAGALFSSLSSSFNLFRCVLVLHLFSLDTVT